MPIGTYIDFALCNARRFYSSMGNPLGRKGLTLNVPRNNLLQIQKKTQDSLGKPCRSVGVLDKTINLLLFRTTRKKVKDDFVKYLHHVTQIITN